VEAAAGVRGSPVLAVRQATVAVAGDRNAIEADASEFNFCRLIKC
jgi:hypothetical protein